MSDQTSTEAASGSEQQSQMQQKRVRKSRPKVKTGCSVCKQRRIKCDEKRPSCTQCVRARKTCLGYPPPPRHSLPLEGIRIAPKPAAVAPAPQTHAIHPTSAGTDAALIPRRIIDRRQQQPQQPLPLLVSLPPGASPLTGAPLITTSSFMPPSIITSTLISPSPTTYSPLPGLPFSPDEALYFSLFRTETLSGLAGLFDSSSWRQRVLQDCHAHPAIRHAAIALGALFKTLEQSATSPTSSPREGQGKGDRVQGHWSMAVQHYSSACNALTRQDGRSYTRTRLLVSTLLGTFDAFIGDHKQAIVQIQNGLSLMGGLHEGEPVERDLSIVLTRLAISAKSYDLAFHFPDPYIIRLSSSGSNASDEDTQRQGTPPVLPPGHQFTNLREARLAHERILDRGIRFLERLQAAQDHAMGFFPAAWERYGSAYIAELAAWESAFSPLFASRTTMTDSRESAAIATLQMEHINARVLFLSLFSASESGFDVFIPHFATIVELAREVVAAYETIASARCQPPPLLLPSPPPPQHHCPHRRWDDPPSVVEGGYTAYHLKPSFTADLGIVPPLFMVATKCREPVLRRRAIHLLRSSARREGMWDSELVARIGQWIMELEEGGVAGSDAHHHHHPQPHAAGLVVPAERRVTIHAVDFDLRSRTAELTVGTRDIKPGNEPDRRFQATRISW